MRETKFIAQNKDKWERYEYLINVKSADPDELNEMYVQISDDLSFARTFYPNRSVRVYLNQIALQVGSLLFKTQRSPWKRFRNFWATELPLLVWESRWEFLISLGVFLLAALIGALSTAIDPDFPRLILGDQYVEMTLQNIKNGDPMAVYKQGWAVTDSLGITANNIFVSFLTFFLGIFASIGSVFMLLRNGIMLGAFQYFFAQKGVLWDSFLAIWLHGTLEISAIVIAGAAGITLGKGLLFPGSFRRAQAFQRSARRGFKIMVGIIPVLIVAGTVEGFLTRYTDAPTYLRLGFIVLSLAFIIFYFVWLPYQSHLREKENIMLDRPLTPDSLTPIDWYKIRSTSVIFSDSFLLLTKNISSIIAWTALCTLFYASMSFLLSEGEISTFFVFNTQNPTEAAAILLLLLNFPYKIAKYVVLLSVSEIPLLAIVHLFIFAFIGAFTFLKITEQKVTIKNLVLKVFKLFIPVALFQSLFLIGNPFVNFLALFFLAFWFLWMWDALVSASFNPFSNFKNAFRLFKSRFVLSISSAMLLLIAGGVFYSLANAVDDFLWGFIELHLAFKATMIQELKALFQCVIGFFCLMLTFVLLLIGAGFTYYTLHEIDSGEALLEKIKQISLQRQIRGLARE